LTLPIDEAFLVWIAFQDAVCDARRFARVGSRRDAFCASAVGDWQCILVFMVGGERVSAACTKSVTSRTAPQQNMGTVLSAIARPRARPDGVVGSTVVREDFIADIMALGLAQASTTEVCSVCAVRCVFWRTS